MNAISKLYTHIANDSLYRNSIFLMLSTAVMAFFGFFFWIINARLFTPEQVGIATTLISIMTLISSFSLLGLGNGLIRYLPASERKNDKINTAFMLVGFTSIVLSIIYLVFLKSFSPKLFFVRESVIFSLLFIFFIAVSSLNTISENVFIAYRSSKYVLIKNTVWSLVKLVLPFALISLGAYGIFMAVGIASTLSFLLCVIFLVWKFKYLFAPVINMDIVKRMARFSLGNYVAGFIGGLPAMVLPILITNSIGAKFSAYFYMDMMVANLLYIIPMAVSQSLFAEGSYSEVDLKVHLKKAIKIISLILIPAILLTLGLGKYILLAFGKNYSSEGILLLQLLAISGIFNSIIYMSGAILRVKNMVKELIILSIINSIVVLSLSFLLTKYNLLGVGVAWLTTQVIMTLAYCIIVIKKITKKIVI